MYTWTPNADLYYGQKVALILNFKQCNNSIISVCSSKLSLQRALLIGTYAVPICDSRHLDIF